MIDNLCKNELIMEVRNYHVPSCGTPPKIDPNIGLVAYFENGYGEQIVLQYDRDKKCIRMWHGDCGWDNEIRVEAFRDYTVIVRVNPPAPAPTDPGQLEFFQKLRDRLRRSFGKPLLTDAECDYLGNTPGLNKKERDVVFALWRLWHRE